MRDAGVAVVLGGTTDDQRLLRSTEVFDAATGRFRPGPDLRDGRYKLAGSAVSLPGDRIVVAGGEPGSRAARPRPREQPTGVSGLGSDWGSFSTLGVTDRLVLVGGYDRDIQLTGRPVGSGGRAQRLTATGIRTWAPSAEVHTT